VITFSILSFLKKKSSKSCCIHRTKHRP